MKIKSFFIKNLDSIKELIIKELPNNEFDSHEFIRHFSKKFENDYVIFLNSYEDHSFRNIHLQIGKCLSILAEDLKIQKIKKVESKNIFGNEIENAKWIKIN